MNLAQSGFHMLMILSVVDGKYDVAEGKVIVNYLTKNYDSEFDLDQENKSLLDIPKELIPEHFKDAAADFLHHSTEAQRLDFIAFAFRLTRADGKIAREENKILTSLSHFWNIDIQPLMDEEKISIRKFQ